jgi:CYTH domain-containing protein
VVARAATSYDVLRETRTVTSLKYAHVERERRWLLLRTPDLPHDLRPLRITDRYLRGTRLRLREVTEPDGTVVRKLGHKVRLGEDAGEVAHTSLYLDEAEWTMLVALPADVLTKTRTLVPYGATSIALDVFDGPLAGLVLAEIDSGEGDEVELPPHYQPFQEVTDDEAFTGGALAQEARRHVS